MSLTLRVAVICLLYSCALASCLAQGTIQISFDGPPVQAPGTARIVTNYTESGMSFVTDPSFIGFGRNNAANSGYPDDGSAYIQQTLAPTAPVLFGFTNGLAFSLLSVDLAEYSTVATDGNGRIGISDPITFTVQ